MHWTRLAFVVGSLLAVVGPYLIKVPSWSGITTPASLGGLLIVLAGWLTAISTNGGAVNVRQIDEATK